MRSEARDTDRWPALQYLWPLHPIVQWLDYKLLSTIGRQRAPVIRVRRGLVPDEVLRTDLGLDSKPSRAARAE